MLAQAPLKRHRLTPNLNLRNMVEDWVAACEVEYLASSTPAPAASALRCVMGAESDRTWRGGKVV